MPSWFFQKNKQVSSIQKYRSDDFRNANIQMIQTQIDNLEEKIRLLTKDLINAQAIGIKIALSPNSNWLQSIQNRLYRNASQESVSWHKERIFLLTKERKSLIFKLERLTGRYWINRIKEWMIIFITACLILLIIGITFMGLIAALYLLPIWASMIFLYFLFKRKIN